MREVTATFRRVTVQRAAVAAALIMTACSSPDTEPETITTAAGGDAAAVEYAPGLSATVHRPPDDRRSSAVVVMVPGGGWTTADPGGFEPLAGFLAEHGITAVRIEIRAAEDGVRYPAPVHDIHCAVGYASALALDEGEDATAPLILLGHSSGAHLAALAASATEPPSADCAHDLALADALIGLAGPYDIEQASDAATPLFGVAIEDDPDLWYDANPMNHAGDRPEVDALLIHGDKDYVVPTSFTLQYADALEDAGHETHVEIVQAADHHTIYSAPAVGSIIVEWIHSLSQPHDSYGPSIGTIPVGS